jgi:hypothetical protein
MHSVSTFFTAYSARRGDVAVEAIAVVVSDGPNADPVIRFVVVDAAGRASLADARELDLYGVIDDAREANTPDTDDAG